MATKRPRTGERRRTQQPLKIDRLIAAVPPLQDIILQLKNGQGKTWQEIEEQSGRTYSQNWNSDSGGFIDWQALPLPVLELFPDLRLPHSNLHRWYDLRVRQVMAEVQARSVQARELAAAFAKSIVAKDDEAVLNAARDQLMSLLAEDTSPKARISATKGLIALAEMLQGKRANDIKERKVAADERRIKLLEDRERQARERIDQATQQAVRKGTGQFSIEDINLLRERTFGLPPLVVAR